MTIKVDRAGISGTNIKPDTPEWQEWFNSAPEGTKIQFEYTADSLKTERFTAYRRKRYWEAQKRVSGKLRNTTIKPSEVTHENLRQILLRLTAYNWADKFEMEESGKCQTFNETPSQTGEEIAQLRAEVERLKNRESYLLDQIGLMKVQIIHEAQERASQLESRVTELDNANWQCEKNLTIVSELHRKSELKRQELQSLVNDYQTKLRKYEAEESDRSSEANLKEEVRRLGAELNLVRQMRDAAQSKHDKVVEDNGRLIRMVREAQAEIDRLQSPTNSPDLEKIRDRVLVTHPPKDRRKLKLALDQFISQCASKLTAGD
jgi:chromosome segregation ATPase